MIDREVASAERAAKDAVFQAQIAQTYYLFLRAQVGSRKAKEINK